MAQNDAINKEIERLKKELVSNRISDSEKQIIRDKLSEIFSEVKKESGDIEKRIVPVETNNIVAHRNNIPSSRFINSSAFKI